MTIYFKGKGYFLDYRERAPAAASRGMYLDAQGRPITDLSLTGNLAAGVPGTVKGLWEAHRRFGKLSWPLDLQPAILLAQKGYVVGAKQGAVDIGGPPPSGQTNFDHYFSGMAAGQRFVQPELAATLKRIAKGGEREFYFGPTAGLIVAQMQRGPAKGLISVKDLADYRAVWREPLRGQWHGFDLITAPPPSSGGIALLQLLTMKADDAPLFKGVQLNSARYVHLNAEIEKRVFADRAAYLGDPDFVRVPTAALVDRTYLARRAAEINRTTPSPLTGVPAGLERPQTTHFSILDRWGNAVANTYTLNGDFGSGVVVEGAGFLLNNEMDDFSVKPGSPNLFGVVGGDANAIAPGKRPLSSMTPTILVQNGKVKLVIGTPGGSRIFTSVYQVLVEVFDLNLTLKAAVAQPRYHHQLLPQNTIFTEPFAPAPAELAANLTALGYKLEDQGFNGDIEAIEVIDGRPIAVADPRGWGVALVVGP